MTDTADRLAEAARLVLDPVTSPLVSFDRKEGLADALAAWDTDRERRQADQAIIDAAERWLDAGLVNVSPGSPDDCLRAAVRRRRELAQ